MRREGEQESRGRRKEQKSRRQRRRGRDSPKGPKSENIIRKDKRIEKRILTRTNPSPHPDP